MIVERLVAENFMIFDELDLALPKTGLVLVSGANGQGKSGLIELIASSFWGETLRSTPPWRPGVVGTAMVTGSGIVAARTCSRTGTKKLEWRKVGSDWQTYPTTTKAQEAVESQVGDFLTWCRTSVFSSASASVFTTATDGERKGLLEQLLGLDLFDTAVKACRADYAAAQREQGAATERLGRAQAMLEREQRALEEARETLATAARSEAATAVDPAILATLEAERQSVTRERDGVIQSQKRAMTEAATARARFRETEASFRRFESGACPTCSTPLAAKRLKTLADDLESASAEMTAQVAATAEVERAAESRIRALKLKLDDISSRIGVFRAQMDAAKSAARVTESIGATVKRSLAARERLEGEVLVARREVSEAALRVSELGAAGTVLGLRGIRSVVLGRALEGIEVVGNDVLAALSPDIRVSLSPTTERKDGTVADVIDVRIHAAGGGYGAGACSAGERRRIDIAFLLGLAITAEGASGGSGDVWFDEVFDALDEDGIAALAELLFEISEYRKVVVISHNPMLLDSLRGRAALRLHVQKGKVHAD